MTARCRQARFSPKLEVREAAADIHGLYYIMVFAGIDCVNVFNLLFFYCGVYLYLEMEMGNRKVELNGGGANISAIEYHPATVVVVVMVVVAAVIIAVGLVG